MELVRIDGSGNDNEREMEEEREICKNDVRIRKPKVVWFVKHQTCI